VVTGAWEVVTASVRGALHDRRGLPNQDAVATVEVGGVLIAAVADGHGGDRYVRSDVGSRFAVDVACAAAADALGDGRQPPLDHMLTALPARIVERWTALVADDVAAHAFDDAEKARAGVPLDDDPTIAYGATLLLAVASDEGVGILQLGDGDVVVGTAGGNILAPVPTDDRLIAGQTTSLCLPTAIADFRHAVVPASTRADLVLLASDGYGNSFADAGWREQVTADLRQRIARDGVDAVRSDLPRWLSDSARAAGDDTTVAVLTRALDDATIPAAALALGPDETTAAHRVQRARPRPMIEQPAKGRGVAIAAGVAAAVVALVVGVLVGRATSSSSSSTTTVPPASTPAASTPVQSAGGIQVIGPNGGTIVFVPDPVAFDAQVVATGGTPSASTQVQVGSDVWSVSNGAVNVRINGGKSTAVGIDDFKAASLVYAGGFVWAIDAEEGHMAAIDPAAHQLVENGVKRIRSAVGGAEQSQAS
jgi:hypothetical protein